MKSFLQFLWAGENPLKNHNNLMHYFDVILLNNVIWAFGPKVSCRVTYVFRETQLYLEIDSDSTILRDFRDYSFISARKDMSFK